MKHAVFVAVVLVAAVGCGGSPETENTGPAVVFAPCAPIEVAPAADLTPMQRGAVAAGLELWNELGFTQLREGTAENAVPVVFQKAAPFFHGFYDPKTGVVYVNLGMNDPHEIAVVVAHELGHAMGLPHVEENERTSVMNPGNLTVTPTSADNSLLTASCPSP